MITERKKRPKAEDFIGWKSHDGTLEVIGVAGKQWYKTLYKVTCTECSKDPELFPDGYFVSLKDNLIRGKLPCCWPAYRCVFNGHSILARKLEKQFIKRRAHSRN